MISEVSGDILLTSAKAIAHGIAPNDDFLNGLARSLREMWPSLYKDFRHYCHEAAPKAGAIWVWTASNGLRIVNLLTQEPARGHGTHPGPAHTEYVNHALRDLREWIKKENIPSIALPRLATGVGKLEWKDVQPLIKKHLGDLKIPVYVYVNYKKGEKANEQ